jgi:serine/threonine-protein kinase
VTKTAPGEPAAEAFGTGSTVEDAPAPPQKTRLLAKGTLIDNKYQIERVLGEGGMGVVYLAEDVHTGVPIVLKAVRPELAHRKDIRDRTLTEGRTLARIDHPNVVHLNAIVEDATGLWLVMQYIDGESLDHTIKRYTKEGGTIAFTVAIDIFRQILNGVGAAHHEGVVHRDLKPANVLVRRKDGVVKVTDFGIAKPSEEMRAGAGAGKTKGVIGSLWYMAPEQVQGRRDLDMRADIYALGVLLFELLTGHVPFNAESSYEIMRMHVEVPLPSVVAERPDAPAWIDEVLGRACAKAREARFSSCEEFLAAIEQHAGPQPRKTQVAAAGLTPGAHDGPHTAVPATMAGTATTGPIAGAGASGRLALFGALALVLVVGGGFAVWQLAKSPDHGPRRGGAGSSAASDKPITSAARTPSATPSAEPPKVDPLDVLAGRWKSEAGTEFDAVKVGSSVEFRVVDPKQLEPSDFREGEARFVLSGGADGEFSVEDKVRPKPPLGMTFDPQSRNTCQEVWTEVDGKPLQATFDGSRLSVDFAKIAPKASNYTLDGKTVVGCSGLRSVAASRGRTVLSR